MKKEEKVDQFGTKTHEKIAQQSELKKCAQKKWNQSS